MDYPTSYKLPPVFINSHVGDFLRGGFVHQIQEALNRIEVNAYADEEPTGEESEDLTQERIEKSRIAIVVFSSRYTESRWCLEELVKIKERMEQGKLTVIPIFYKLEGGSGLNLENPGMRDFDPEKVKIWNEALDSVSCTMGYHLYKSSDESRFITNIVKEVKRLLIQIPVEECVNESHDSLSEQQKDASVDGESVLGEAELSGESIKDEANERVDSVNEEVSTSSTLVSSYKPPPDHKVFINFLGTDLHDGFVGHIVEALEKVGFNVYVDEEEPQPGDLTELLFKRIEESRVAVVIFSSRYTESTWCLDKLVKIKECMDEGKLLIIPIFYKVKQLQVKQLEGNFGVRLWNLWRIHRGHQIIKCKEALEYVGGMRGFPFEELRLESELITSIVQEVIDHMIKISARKNPSLFHSPQRGESTQLPTGEDENHDTYLNEHPFFGIDLRMQQLEQKLEFDNNETRIIGVVGMPGVGKTTLAMMLHEKWNRNFVRCMPLMGIRKMLNDHEPAWLRKTLLEVLLEGNFPVTNNETTHESVKDKLLQAKVFVILDDVSEKKQLDILLGNLDWIKKGSKIVITTCDKSLLEGFANDTYVVPLLNDKEAFQLFCYHAFDDKINSPSGTFLTLSRVYVDYARGHPLALILLAIELRGKEEAYWKHRLEKVTHSYDTSIWRFSTDQLNEQQKDVFDIIYFFISGDEYFIRCLLGSEDSDTTEPVSVLKDLADKFLITISGGRVEMNDLLYRFGKGLGSPWRRRLWNYNDIYSPKEINTVEANNVRGVLLDMSKVTGKIDLESTAFTNMDNLRYLKVFDSNCPRQCKTKCKLHVPNGFKFPLKGVRYFHWVKFPLEELPPDFSPGTLVDLRLPYSNIEHVWKDVKATPRLKWVDLRHSSKLLDLSALSKAENLQRLILEGCTNLKELPRKIQKMKSLVFLNLRGCIRLSSLPLMNLISLKTLILSDCTNLEEFQPISESLEVLHLDGTAIKGLPPAIKNLQRLVLLNLKNCKMLECLPNCLGELKALEELILSGCSRLENLSNVKESMKHLLSLLIDSIGAKEMPNICQASADMVLHSFGPSSWPCVVSGVSFLQRLCLSGNDFVSLQSYIGKLYDLKWLDVKDCKKLRSLPMLPPKLQYFDAHGCDSLESVATPLVLPVLTEQTSVRFNFSNCNKLDQDAKDSIISYIQWKSQFLLDSTLFRYNGGFVFEALTGTCFPGWEVPAWFSHQSSGPLLEIKLRPHLCDNRFTGIALCAVILFPGHLGRSNRLVVTCNCVFKYEDGSCIRFSCTVGSWNEPSNTVLKLESSHVFIGYTTMLDNKKHGGKDNEEGCTLTDASLEFQVTDGTEDVVGCRVLNCGFSLVYASDERENTCSDAKRIEKILGETKTLEKSPSHDDIQNESSCLTLGTEENFLTEVESGANLSLRESLENKRADTLSVESGGEITLSFDHENTSSGNLEKPEMSYFWS
ncbi:unnamed protein product [Eruca vesicaria subsp. sativa]|uniref:ADP-ribosyl cyclase/cyclic ADP-ribose hydrolase n=1 Tax=Eruca vesicaria subsp. sativa TaxID=29727 RepID=A0ABC8JS17_ERUVS|nr:unnamed protein product [Eruca vesicaria subsp. sativa]